jgi:zinc transport system permease protein
VIQLDASLVPAFFRDLGTNPFLLSGLVAGILASVACGVVSPYVVTRRLVFLAGALAHIAIGGVGAAIFLAWASPRTFGGLTALAGGTAVAVLSAPILALLHHRVRERLDTVVGVLWAGGMASGLLLIKLTPGYHTELMSYLFGSLVFVGWRDVALLALLAAVVVITTLFFQRRFLALCLDPEQATLRGIPVLATDTVLLVLMALTVICLTQIVGLVLVIALMSLPAATAGRLVSRMAPTIWVTVGLSAALVTLPRLAVYGTRVSPEAAIVLAAVALYLFVAALTRARWRRRARPSVETDASAGAAARPGRPA